MILGRQAAEPAEIEGALGEDASRSSQVIFAGRPGTVLLIGRLVGNPQAGPIELLVPCRDQDVGKRAVTHGYASQEMAAAAEIGADGSGLGAGFDEASLLLRFLGYDIDDPQEGIGTIER